MEGQKKKIWIGSRNIWRNNSQILILTGILVTFFVIMSILLPRTFLSRETMQSMGVQLPEFGIYSIAMMFAMLSGGIDLSIVSIGNLSSIIACQYMISRMAAGTGGSYMMTVIVGIALACGIGIICGLCNGFSVSVIGIPPMLSTLASMAIFDGISTILTKGSPLQGLPEEYSVIGNYTLFHMIPMILIIFIVVALAAYVILNRTTLGIKIYTVGSNEKAAIFSGIQNTYVIMSVYAISGLLSAIAGIILTSRSMSAKMDYGSIYQLQAILAVVLGGVSPKGGAGRVGGVVLAVLSLQILSTGLNILNLASTSYLKNLMWGILLVVVLVMNYFIDKKKSFI